MRIRSGILAIILSLATATCPAAGLLARPGSYSSIQAAVDEGGAWEYESLGLNFRAVDVMSDGVTVIAGSAVSGRIYKSVDKGLHWTDIWTYPGVGSASITCLFIDSRDYIFVSAHGDVRGLYRSTDRGRTFSEVWNPHDTRHLYNGICEDDRGHLYIAPHDNAGAGQTCELFKSTDGGATWFPVLDVPEGKHFHTIIFAPDFGSTNKWLYAYNGDPSKQDGEYVYLPHLWRSRDYGATWEHIQYGDWRDWTFFGIGYKDGYVYLGTHGAPGLGLSWNRVFRFPETTATFVTLVEVLSFYTGYGPTEYDMLENWFRVSPDGQWILLGGEARASKHAIWASQSGAFGTWRPIVETVSQTGDYKGFSYPSYRWEINGWLYVGNTRDGDGIRMRFASEQAFHLAVRGNDNRMYHRMASSSDGSWGEWNALPGATCDSPAAVVLQNKLHIGVRGMDGRTIWYGSVDLSTDVFSGWALMKGATQSAPTLTSNGTALCLVVRGLSDRIYYAFSVNDSWTSWNVVPAGATCDTPGSALLGSNLHIVVRGMDGKSLWHVIVRSGGAVIRGWERVTGATQSRPVLAAIQSRRELYLVVRGLNSRIFHGRYNSTGDSWEPWKVLSTGTTCDGPAAIVLHDKLHFVVRGMSGTSLWHKAVTLITGTTSNWELISGSTDAAPTLAG